MRALCCQLLVSHGMPTHMSLSALTRSLCSALILSPLAHNLLSSASWSAFICHIKLHSHLGWTCTHLLDFHLELVIGKELANDRQSFAKAHVVEIGTSLRGLCRRRLRAFASPRPLLRVEGPACRPCILSNRSESRYESIAMCLGGRRKRALIERCQKLV